MAQIFEFRREQQLPAEQAESWGMTGAAHIIYGYISDDSFSDFVAWLMMHGREVFEAAVADPDSLADLPIALIDGYAGLEAALFVDSAAYDNAVGREHAFWDNLPDDEPSGSDTGVRGEPLPRTAAEAEARWPQLWSRFAVPRIAEQAKYEGARGWFQPPGE